MVSYQVVGPHAVQRRGFRIVENERALWKCYEGGACYAPDREVCDCKLTERANHDPGDEDRRGST